MRCPKCGYISFDHQETCKNCKKNIGDIIAEINGTVYDAIPPMFLQLAADGRFQVSPSPSQMTDKKEELADNEMEIDLREGIDTEFILDDEAVEEFPRNEITLPDTSDELLMELDDFSEVSPREEYTLELGEERGETEPKMPALDFGDLDISDLAPPGKEQSDTPQLEEEQVLAGAEPVAALSGSSPQQPKTSAIKSSGLEDLSFNGLDLDSPAKLVTGSAAGKRYLPSVKTGTALDKFDIDLGELFAENKK